jgi:hypothetical protein
VKTIKYLVLVFAVGLLAVGCARKNKTVEPETVDVAARLAEARAASPAAQVVAPAQQTYAKKSYIK